MMLNGVFPLEPDEPDAPDTPEVPAGPWAPGKLTLVTLPVAAPLNSTLTFSWLILASDFWIYSKFTC